jgi:SAM-dependent methyltransferase
MHDTAVRDEPAPMTPADAATAHTRGDRLRLVALSALMLFVELAIIRWAGSNVLYLSYFSNFLLLGSFLGIGIGFLRAERHRNLFRYAPVALATLVVFVRFFPVDVRREGGDLIFFGGEFRPSGPPRELTLTLLFIVVAATMAFIAEGVARAFARFESLEAYRLDIIGAVIGIVGISTLAFLRAPPLVWGVVVSIAFVVLQDRRDVRSLVWVAVPLLAMVVPLALESFAPGTTWSPYYKVVVTQAPGEGPFVTVNGIPHQALFHATDNVVYESVYQQLADPKVDDVLIIGAGGGNDVSVALARGAQRVDAVEIDPRLYENGRQLHPDRPYDDPRVHVHIDDGRAFLERTERKYDLILFGLPDSLTLVSGQSSLRLESYLFTRDAIDAVRERLKPGGAFAMYNYYREQWLIERLAGTVAAGFDRAPCVNQEGAYLAVIVDATDDGVVDCAAPWHSDPKADLAGPATDDHPFPYLRHRSLPPFYQVTMLAVLLLSLLAVRAASGPFRRMSAYVDLFCMGAAFLLLETKNVVQFALLFGTTWFVNALVFAGVLLSVLLAIEVSQRVRWRRPVWLYAGLAGALVVAWVVPGHALLALPVVPRFALAAAIAFAPIFIANLIFAHRFRDVGSSTAAFGANLLGAIAGGLLEYSALLFGYRSLLLGVSALYALAFVFGRAHLRVSAT